MTHDELAIDLAAHLRGGSKRVTWCDMQLGPSGSPRPDVYSMEPTYTRLTFEAFEVKVSVSDFRADVTSGKWQSYLKYANSVTFAVPAGLINKAAVPSTCGLIVRHATGWRYAKKPTRHVLTEIPWQAWIKLLLDGVERSETERKARRFSDWDAERALAKRWGQETAKLVHDINALPQELAWRQKKNEESLASGKAVLDGLNEQINQARAVARERCDKSLLQLATALGMQGEPTVDDLNARAARLAAFLMSDPNGWRRSPLMAMAIQMENLAGEMRELCGSQIETRPA